MLHIVPAPVNAFLTQQSLAALPSPSAAPAAPVLSAPPVRPACPLCGSEVWEICDGLRSFEQCGNRSCPYVGEVTLDLDADGPATDETDPNACPECGSVLGVVNLYCGGRGYVPYDSCTAPTCPYQKRQSAF